MNSKANMSSDKSIDGWMGCVDVKWCIYIIGEQLLSINEHQKEIVLAISSQEIQLTLCQLLPFVRSVSRSRPSSWPQSLLPDLDLASNPITTPRNLTTSNTMLSIPNPKAEMRS